MAEIAHFAADDGLPACTKHARGQVTKSPHLVTCHVCELQLARKHRGPVTRDLVSR